MYGVILFLTTPPVFAISYCLFIFSVIFFSTALPVFAISYCLFIFALLIISLVSRSILSFLSIPFCFSFTSIFIFCFSFTSASFNSISGMSWGNQGKNGWVLDHIIPRIFFQYKSIEDVEFRYCWSLINLSPLWVKDNLDKGDKITLWGKEIRAQDINTKRASMKTCPFLV